MSVHHIPATMRAAVADRVRTALRIAELPVPRPGPFDVLIKVLACGVCHSDVHAVDGDWSPAAAFPLIPGHEVTGTVAALGEHVTGVEVGDLVGVPWIYSTCGLCDWCLDGMESICPEAEATGYSKPGGYAEYMIAPAAFTVALPDGCDPVAIAPILCAGVTTYRGLKRSGARPGDWAAVIGIGGLGHLAVQYAVAMGLRVIAVDVADDKLELAASLGAERWVNSALGDPVEAVRTATGGVKASLVTATASRAFEQAVGMLRPAGTVVFIGMPGGEGDMMRLSIGAVVGGEWSIRGSSVGTRLDLREAVDFATRGTVRTAVTTARLDEINEVFDRMRGGQVVGRVVLSFG